MFNCAGCGVYFVSMNHGLSFLLLQVLTEAARIMSSGREVLQNASKMHLAQLHEIMAKSSHEEPPDEQDKELLW